MKPGVRERLKMAVTMLELQQSDISKATGYAQANISNILKKGEPTLKFINIFCMAYPKVNRTWILENEGSPLLGEDVSIFGFLHTVDTVKTIFMERQIEELTIEVRFLRSMLAKAFNLHPDLEGKLLKPLAKHGNKQAALIANTSAANLFSQVGANKGAFSN